MDVKKAFASALEAHGQEVTLTLPDRKVSYKAFIQLMRYKNKIYIDMPQGEIGRRDNSCFLYIGPPDHDFTRYIAAVRLTFDGAVFGVKRAEKIYYKNEPLYVWAVLGRVIKDGGHVYEDD